MNWRPILLFVGCALVVALCWTLLLPEDSSIGKNGNATTPTSAAATIKGKSVRPTVSRDRSSPREAIHPSVPSSTLGDRQQEVVVKDYLERLLDEAREKTSSFGLPQMLPELAEAIQRRDRDEVAAALVEFLHSGKDVETGLPFVVKENGSLSSTSRLRPFLLGVLGEIALDQALTYAEGAVFDGPRSSEEWTVALRNLAWADVEGFHGEQLRDRFLRLTSEDKWVANPDGAFLNALDVAVHLGDSTSFHQLAQLSASGNEDTARAAALALDRMVLRDGDARLQEIAKAPEILSVTPELRARLMARADVRSPVQRGALIEYLSSPSISTEEAEAFSAAFPYHNLAIGNRLLTTDDSETSSLREIAEIDHASLNFLATGVEGMASVFKTPTERTRTTLDAYVRSAAKR